MEARGFVTLKEAADRVARPPRSVQVWCGGGTVVGEKNGRFWFVKLASLFKHAGDLSKQKET
jgi:hypothetical protein